MPRIGMERALERLTEAAVHLFRERGYASVSVDEIVSAAGVTKGTFYYYLTSKAELLYRIHDKFISQELEEGERILAMDESPAVKLRMLVRSLIRSINDYLPYVTVFFNEMRHLEEPYYGRIREKRDRYAAMFEETIREAIRRGEFRANLDPKLTTLGLFGMCNWMYRWYRPDGPLSDSEIAEHFLSILLHGMEAR
ncbi:MAG TPA: TetR/AcrR family transcriptional regulator [Calditerricola sp.]